jgi:hypothetical protein
VPVSVLTAVEDDGFLQPRAKPVFQETKAAQVFTADAGACFDLEGDYLAVVAFKDEVYLVARLRAKVADRYRSV